MNWYQYYECGKGSHVIHALRLCLFFGLYVVLDYLRNASLHCGTVCVYSEKKKITNEIFLPCCKICCRNDLRYVVIFFTTLHGCSA